jgi:hypothetical protein
MSAIHFQSIYRRFGMIIAEPLCGPERESVETSALKHEVTCQFCLRFLMELKENSHA